MRPVTSVLILLPAAIASSAQNGAQNSIPVASSNAECPLQIIGGSVAFSESPSRIWDKVIRKDLLRLEVQNTSAVSIKSFLVEVNVTYYGVVPLKLVKADPESQFYSYDGIIDPQRRIAAEWKLLMPAAGLAKATLRKVVFTDGSEWSGASDNGCDFTQDVAVKPLRQSA
jgi:hypothetical protein